MKIYGRPLTFGDDEQLAYILQRTREYELKRKFVDSINAAIRCLDELTQDYRHEDWAKKKATKAAELILAITDVKDFEYDHEAVFYRAAVCGEGWDVKWEVKSNDSSYSSDK